LDAGPAVNLVVGGASVAIATIATNPLDGEKGGARLSLASVEGDHDTATSAASISSDAATALVTTPPPPFPTSPQS